MRCSSASYRLVDCWHSLSNFCWPESYSLRLWSCARAANVEIVRIIASSDEHHAGARAFLHDSLRLRTDAHHAYAHSDVANRRLANQAFHTQLEVADDEQLRPGLAELFANLASTAARGK